MYKTEGIVVRELKYKESSKIVTVFSPKYGLMDVYAKGAYRPKSRLVAPTSLFALSKFQMSSGHNFMYIRDVDNETLFYGLREKFERMIIANYLAELVCHSVIKNEAAFKQYYLVKKALGILENLDSRFFLFMISFDLKYASFLGYMPVLNSCSSCLASDSEYCFSYEDGGLLCGKCGNMYSHYGKIESDGVKLLRRLLHNPMEEIFSIDENKETRRLHKLINGYLSYCIDRERFISLDMLKAVLK